MASTRVLLVDDHPVVLHGVSQLLASTSDFQVVGAATTGAEALELAALHQPDLILLDLRLGDLLAPDLCQQLRAITPDTDILILTAYDDEALLRSCLAAGARGVLLKDIHDFDFMQSLRTARDGGFVFDGRLRIEGPSRTLAAGDEVFGQLTPREYEVLRIMARGMTSREMADELGLSLNTVRSYVQSVLTKLHVTNRVQALTTAQRLRLI